MDKDKILNKSLQDNKDFVDNLTKEQLEKLMKPFDVSQQRELLIAYHMNTLFHQKSEENRKFVEAAVDVYLSNL